MSEDFDRWGIDWVVARDATEARDAMDNAVRAGNPFDVAIVDIKGLGDEGIELARRLRGGAEASPALILLVGMNNLADDFDIETLGAAAILTKPARPSALFDCFASIASGVAGKGPLIVRRNARTAAASFDARVLVVEDNAVNQEVATGILENMDCSVVVAANGRCAVERFKAEAFDLILMDCEMPIMDGFEAATQIRRIESERAAAGGTTAPIAIVALTAHALAEIREQCLHSGMNDFLVKPFDELQIVEMLRRWIPRREQAPRKKTIARLEPSPPAPREHDEIEEVIDVAAISKIRAIAGNGKSALFERVVAQFAATAPSLAAALRQQCEAGDADAAWRTAHSLKSSAAALGAGRVSRCCAKIEALAKESGTAPASDLLDALEADLATAQRALNELVGAEHV